VVDVIDPATGTIRLKAKIADADEMALDTRSTKTVRVRKLPARIVTGPRCWRVFAEQGSAVHAQILAEAAVVA
jgi:von Willebrand factor type A C-terminal domain